MSKTATQKLQRSLHGKIPLSRAMGISVGSSDWRGLTLEAPLSRNINDKGTAFAGSLSNLVTLAGWGWIHLQLNEEPKPYKVAITHGSIQYHAPVRRTLQAICERPDETSINYFLATLRRRGRARIILHCRIGSRRKPNVSFTGTYVAYRS